MTAPAHTFTRVPVETVKPGDRYHSLGVGFIGRDVDSVTVQCNCQGRARSIHPETREPLHFEVVVIRSAGGAMTSTYRPGQLVTVSDGAF